MGNWLKLITAGLLLIPVSPEVLSDQDYTLSKRKPESKKVQLALPFVFNTEDLGFGYGIGGGMTLEKQPWAAVGGAIMRANRGAQGLYLIANDIRLPKTERWFTYGRFASGWYNNLRGYFDVPGMPQEGLPGSNLSEPDNFVEANGFDGFAELDFIYVLPIGDASESSVYQYWVEDGFLAGPPRGAKSWNPLESGVTRLLITPFAQWRDYELPIGDVNFWSNGIRFQLSHNNRDYAANPERGSYKAFTIKRDFGGFGSDDSWTTIELDLRKYLPARLFPGLMDQEVFALRANWKDTPTWEDTADGVRHRAPHFMGAALGGMNRLKAYPRARFNGRSFAFYSAEYRFIPKYKSLRSINLPFGMKLEWLQFVLFAEAGKVSNQWDFSGLHKHMQTDVGAGVRLNISDVVVRLDFAHADESAQFWIMIGQSF